MPENKYQLVFDHMIEWADRMAKSNRVKQYVRNELHSVRDQAFAYPDQGNAYVIQDEENNLPVWVFPSIALARKMLVDIGYTADPRNNMRFTMGRNEMKIYDVTRVG